LLGQVVVDTKRVAALFVHVILGEGTTGIGSEILQGSRLGRRRDDDNGEVHGTVLAQALDGLGDGRFLLTDGDVDADDVLFSLVDDGVERDGRLPGLAVADNQLALPAANRRHGVY